MSQPHPANLNRLIALVEETEQILARGVSSHDIRQACALARGYLDLALSYDEPVSMETIERVICRMRDAFALEQLSPKSAPGHELSNSNLA